MVKLQLQKSCNAVCALFRIEPITHFVIACQKSFERLVSFIEIGYLLTILRKPFGYTICREIHGILSCLHSLASSYSLTTDGILRCPREVSRQTSTPRRELSPAAVSQGGILLDPRSFALARRCMFSFGESDWQRFSQSPVSNGNVPSELGCSTSRTVDRLYW